MGLFKKHRTRVEESRPAGAITDIDWADPAAIFVEWENVDEDPAGWHNGMRLFDEGPIPAQRLNVAEYMTRALRLHLGNEGPLREDAVVETCRRILVLLSDLPDEPAYLHEFAPRLVRLPLAIMRERGWQPAKYGGDGRVQVDLDSPSITAAVATTRVMESRYLQYFFGAA